MKSIHQFVAGFANGDAISNEARELRNIFRSWGCKSEIFSEQKRILPELKKDAFDISDYMAADNEEDIVILHLSIGSVVNDAFKKLKSRKAILYHNITPASYLELINRQTANSLTKGRDQVEALVNVAEVNMADSKYNANELSSLGYNNVSVLPLVLKLDKLTNSHHKTTAKKISDGLVNILFVGRCVPNKKIEDALTAFYYFNKYVEPRSRFIHVGSYAGTERYYNILLLQVKELGLTNSVRFMKAVPQAHLNTYYKHSSIFLCMSEHEGFCIPLLESMVHDLPILAYDAAAVPETLDSAGVLVREKNFEMIAEMMGKMVHNHELRASIIRGQQERLERYKALDLESELKNNLAPMI